MSKSQARRLAKLEVALGAAPAVNSLAETIQAVGRGLGLPALTWGATGANPEYVAAWEQLATAQQAAALARSPEVNHEAQ